MAAPSPLFSPLKLSRREIWILFSLLVLCRALAALAVPLYDDAFITYRYALNFARGEGMVFNPGEPWEPVLGTTTPAYALLLGGFARLGLDLTWVSPALNLVFDLVSARLLLELLDHRRMRAGVALLAFAALPQLARTSVGGMESPLFALLALGAALAAERGRWGLAGVLAALDCTVRPEGVLLVGALALCALLARGRFPRLWRLLAPVALIGLVTAGVLVACYGDCVPQSVHAKSAMNAASSLRDTLWRMLTIVEQSFVPHPSYLLLLPLVVWGALRALLQGPALRGFSLFALGITAAYLLARPHVWGWYFYVPLTGWCVWLGMGWEAAVRRIHASLDERQVAFGQRAGIALGAGLVLLAFAGASTLRRTRVRERVYGPLQEWARAESRLHPHARILAADIGAIGWAWSGTVLDSEGLTWPAALLYKLPNRMIEEFRPEYLLIVAEQPRVKHFYDAPDLYEQYEPIARFSPDGEAELEPALENLPPVWKQDYLLYRRRDLGDAAVR